MIDYWYYLLCVFFLKFETEQLYVIYIYNNHNHVHKPFRWVQNTERSFGNLKICCQVATVHVQHSVQYNNNNNNTYFSSYQTQPTDRRESGYTTQHNTTQHTMATIISPTSSYQTRPAYRKEGGYSAQHSVQ